MIMDHLSAQGGSFHVNNMIVICISHSIEMAWKKYHKEHFHPPVMYGVLQASLQHLPIGVHSAMMTHM